MLLIPSIGINKITEHVKSLISALGTQTDKDSRYYSKEQAKEAIEGFVEEIKEVLKKPKKVEKPSPPKKKKQIIVESEEAEEEIQDSEYDGFYSDGHLSDKEDRALYG